MQSATRTLATHRVSANTTHQVAQLQIQAMPAAAVRFSHPHHALQSQIKIGLHHVHGSLPEVGKQISASHQKQGFPALTLLWRLLLQLASLCTWHCAALPMQSATCIACRTNSSSLAALSPRGMCPDLQVSALQPRTVHSPHNLQLASTMARPST